MGRESAGRGWFCLTCCQVHIWGVQTFQAGRWFSCSKQWGVALGDGSCARGERVVLPYMLPGAHLYKANLSGQEVILLQLAVGCGAR